MPPKKWFRLVGLSALVALGMLSPVLSEQRQGKKYALLVGVRSYDAKLDELKFTENDAEGMAAVLKGYDEVVVLTTTRGSKDDKLKPTKANIEAHLKRLLAMVTKRDTILIGLAGHGVQYTVKKGGKDKDESFFCPSDAKLLDTNDFDKLAEKMISFSKLFEQLDKSDAGTRLLLIDACRNDPKARGRNAEVDTMPRLTKGTAALFGCASGQRAFETSKLGDRGGNGVFFHHVITALKEAEKSEKGVVTWDDMTQKVRGAVAKYVPKEIGGGAEQTPHLLTNLVGDPILVAAGKGMVQAPKDKGKDKPVDKNAYATAVGSEVILAARPLIKKAWEKQQDKFFELVTCEVKNSGSKDTQVVVVMNYGGDKLGFRKAKAQITLTVDTTDEAKWKLIEIRYRDDLKKGNDLKTVDFKALIEKLNR